MVLVVPRNELTQAAPISPGTFLGENVLERRHIQEWLRHNPQMLGEDLLVFAIEFDQFEQVADRPDVLAIDRTGHLVIIELKRDSYAGYADLQAIRYAALLSTVTVSDVVNMYVRYCHRYLNQPEQTAEAALQQLKDFINDTEFDKLTGNPRIIICSENFSPAITTTVLWLNKVGLDISCVRLQPYSVNQQLIIVPTKIIPTPEASQYMVQVQRKERQEEAAEKQTQTKRRRTMEILLENQILKAGDKLYMKANLPSYVPFADNDKRFIATVIGGDSQQVRWEADQAVYRISALTRKIFNSFNQDFNRTPNGNAHWTNEEGRLLWHLAEDHLGGVEAD